MSNPNTLQVQSANSWTQPNPEGDGQYALCDIFTGESLIGPQFDREPRMPAALLQDPELAAGAEAWRNMRIDNLNVYLIDPSDPDGLGDERAFWDDILPAHTVAGFAVQRSVLRTERRRQSMQWDDMGQSHPEQPNETLYMDLLDIKDAGGDRVFDFDLPVDGQGRPQTPAGIALAEARDIAGFGAFEMEYPQMTDTFYELDISYTNTLGWALALRAGAKLYEATNGENPDAALLMVAPEHRDIARKLGLLAADKYGRPHPVTTVAALPDQLDATKPGFQIDYANYTGAMQNGAALPRSLWY